jgi:hypothetical protein
MKLFLSRHFVSFPNLRYSKVKASGHSGLSYKSF